MESAKPFDRKDEEFENNELGSSLNSDENLFDESEWDNFILRDTEKLDKKISNRLFQNINKGRIGSKRNRQIKIYRTVGYTLLTAAILLAVFGIRYYQSGQSSLLNEKLLSGSENIEVHNTDQINRVVNLPDGSIVTLAKDSKLTYPRNFSATTREIILDGTATFQVAKDSARPFSVDCKGLMTVALGTIFTVRSDNSGTEVYLTEGRVKVFVKNKEQYLSYLTPGDKVLYQQHEGKFQYVANPFSGQKAEVKKSIKREIINENDNAAAYEVVGSEYVFKNIELYAMIRSLEKIYSCKIVYPQSIAHNNMYLNIDTNQSINIVLNNIVLLNDLQLEQKGPNQFHIFQKK